MLSMGGPVTGNALRDVLRTLTGDPDLEVYYRLPHREEYVTSDGEPAPGRDRISANATRQLIGAGTVDEQGFTALVETAAPADRASRTLRRAVLEAATPALENARLQATLRRQVLDLISSRSQTVRAFLAERRRLEGQLHDGTQACLYEARSQVSSARLQVSDPAATGSIEAAAATLGDAITELRTLVRGIYPAGLRETGLGNALFTATHELPLVVEIADDEDIDLDEVDGDGGVLHRHGRPADSRAVTRPRGGGPHFLTRPPPGPRTRLRVEYTPAASRAGRNRRLAGGRGPRPRPGRDHADHQRGRRRDRGGGTAVRVVIAEDSVFRNSIDRDALRRRDTRWPASPGPATSCSRYLNRSGPPDVAVLDIRMPPDQNRRRTGHRRADQGQMASSRHPAVFRLHPPPHGRAAA